MTEKPGAGLCRCGSALLRDLFRLRVEQAFPLEQTAEAQEVSAKEPAQ